MRVAFVAVFILWAVTPSVASAKCPYSTAEVETAMESATPWVTFREKLPKACPLEHINIVRAIKERLEARFPEPEKRSFLVLEKILRARVYLNEHNGQEVRNGRNEG